MKRKILAMAMALVMAMGMTACQNNTASTADSGENQDVDTSAGGYRIALLMSHQTNAFTTAVSKGALAEAEKHGVTVDVFDGKQEQATQAAQMEQCVSQGYDGILVEPISVDGIAPAVKIANEAGIPVMTVVQKMAQQDLAVAHCGADDAKAAKLQMEKAIEAMGGSGNIVILYGPMGSDAQLVRKEGYDLVLSENPDVNVVFESTANWTTDEALSKMETWLQTGTEIHAVVSQNDSMALGAQKAIEDAGKQGEIMVYGIDAVPEGIASIAAGKMAGSVSQDSPEQGALGVRMMIEHLDGKTVDPTNYTECVWVTKENVSDYQ